MIKIFGAAFDPLDIFERVDIKLAYLNWLKVRHSREDRQLDPYDCLKSHFKKVPKANQIEWIGKFPVDSWLRPKPSISDIDEISPRRFIEFLDRNGCDDYCNRLVNYLESNIGPAIPIMIGVDHCLTGGVIKFLHNKYGDDFNIVILDSHCDIIDLETRSNFFGTYLGHLGHQSFGEDTYECGSFLVHLLNKGIIRPERLWIIGTQDLDQFRQNAETLYLKKILPWVGRGLHIISKENLVLFGIPEEIKGPTYISFDMDLGSLSSVLAARFLNYVGLNIEQFVNLVNEVSQKIARNDIDLIGLDIMEMDIHFLGRTIMGSKDCTRQIAIDILSKVVYSNFVR